MSNPILPDLPRPDLPCSHPLNYPTLKIQAYRRLGLPDDGGLYAGDAIDSDVLRGYHGQVVHDDEYAILIDFASLADAVAWAGIITTSGRDRSGITFVPEPRTPYEPATIRIALA